VEVVAKAERFAVASFRQKHAQLIAATKSERRAEHLAARRHYAALASEAAQALLDREVHRTASLLATCPESLRGWEWRHMRWRVPLLVTRKTAELPGPIREVQFVTNGRYIVYSARGELRLQDANHQTVGKWTIPIRLRDDSPVAIRSDGAVIAIARTGSFDEDIIELYGVHEGTTLRELMLPESFAGMIRSLCFRAERNELLLSVATEGDIQSSIILLDVADGRLTTLGKHHCAAHRLTFHKDSQRFAFADDEGCIWVWRIGDELPRRLQRERGRVSDRLAFSPDGVWLAAGSASGYGILWNLETETSVLLRGHVGQVVGVCFHDEGGSVTTAGVDGIIRQWSLPDGTLRAIYRGHELGITSIAR
jgi:WD40 repeat protein